MNHNRRVDVAPEKVDQAGHQAREHEEEHHAELIERSAMAEMVETKEHISCHDAEHHSQHPPSRAHQRLKGACGSRAGPEGNLIFF